jgi:anaerobic selenocysteine-containing dehydrogenase
LTDHVRPWTPEASAAATGLDPDEIVALSREYARASPSLIRVLIGLEHHASGGSACRAVAMLPALTGAWREHGGGLMNMTYELGGTALNWTGLDLPERLRDVETRTINMIRIGRALTDSTLDPPIRALIVFNANPAVTMPDQNAVLRGLAREDLLTVVVEHFVTDTARYADYVFPATSVLENWDLLTSWGTPYVHLNEPAIEPLGEARTNTAFFRALAHALGHDDADLHLEDLDVVRSLLDSDHPYLEGITFERLREEGWARLRVPDPWMPHAEGNFKTPSGRCRFVAPDLDPPLPLPSTLSEEERSRYPIQLLTVKTPARFLNSSHANIDRLRRAEGAPRLDLDPADARARGLADGATVRVFNDRGEVRLRLRISDRVRPGVACMPQGYWASLVEGGSTANALTSDATNDLGGGAALQSARVQVEAVADPGSRSNPAG